MTRIDQQIARALECARAGDKVRAEKIIRAVLDVDPSNFDALQLYGGACLERGDLRAARPVLAEALGQDPTFPPIHMNYGNCLARTGKHGDALKHFNEALRLRPAYPQALYNRALSLKELGRTGAAVDDLRKAVSLSRDDVEMLAACGEILLSLDAVEEAHDALRDAAAKSPRNADYLAGLGAALAQRGDPQGSIEYFNKAIALAPQSAGPHRRHADALARMGNLEAAVASYARAISLSPDNPEAFKARAKALMQLGRKDEAEEDMERAFDSYARNSVARLEAGNIEGALRDVAHALEIHPNDVNGLIWQGTLHFQLANYADALKSRQAARDNGDRDNYRVGELCNVKSRLGEWEGLRGLIEDAKDRLAKDERLGPFHLLAFADDPPLHKKAAEIWARDTLAQTGKPRPLPQRTPAKRINIGYFSADYCLHPVSLLISAVFGEHDRQRYHVSGFSLTRVKDAAHQRIRTAFDEFHDVFRAPDEDITLLARKHKIDIAVDLTGYTTDSRTGVFARRAAPIQVNYLGFPGTMGADFMDYIIADPVLIPPHMQAHYTEKVAYMPLTYQPNDRLRPIAASPATRTECGLPPGGFVFCCFNDTYKIAPERFDIWMRILKRVDGSILWLLANNPQTEANFRKEAAARGVDPSRIFYAPRAPLPIHLGRHRFADLFLDTAPYNAHTTASDALWAGVPVLTLPGLGMQARVASSLLTAAGVPELITTSEEDYENLAVRLAAEPELLGAIKKKVLAARLGSPLFDVTRFTRDLERLYEEMMRRHRAGLPPDHIVLPGA